ncbi:DNA-processing protein DprA [Streptomyces sp. MST-110588]|uniref:DNA-processing protein DprA n=1 Tax=Streptomyces sp. MST-110588 TaxID=2833628 RepID=UPI001F5C3BEA|nr:DNA-processing protein DprA [Streptomyces sp. MST-110588]UNO42214.1 DNA-processing protein DprA [Streptomyces sp. MST-110588]
MTSCDTDLITARRVTITGTRETSHRSVEWFDGLFAGYLAPFATGGTHFYVGGALGIDSLALLWLAGNTGSSLTVVVPGTAREQPADAREAISRVRDRVSSVVELGASPLRTAAFHARNRWMVDRSDLTIGFPLAGRTSSGTWQTLDYTAERGLPRLIVPV